MTLAQLIEPVQLDFEAFQQEYQRRTRSTVPLLGEVEAYLGQHPGKQLRPLLVLLAAKACNTLTNHHIVIATIVEMLHNATLMHDDVVDESPLRRGHDSVRHRWGNQVAVLCGDYYLAQAMDALHQVQDDEVTHIVNRTVVTLCEGELKQLAHAGQELDEANYLDIIGSKTAALFAACCELGACGNGGSIPLSYRKAMRDFGYYYGLVFQMRDDMLDTDSRHDATLQAATDLKQLIDLHTQLAHNALVQLPDSSAREAMASLLLPTAPQPTNLA